jgi:hypothetical protein
MLPKVISRGKKEKKRKKRTWEKESVVWQASASHVCVNIDVPKSHANFDCWATAWTIQVFFLFPRINLHFSLLVQ